MGTDGPDRLKGELIGGSRTGPPSPIILTAQETHSLSQRVSEGMICGDGAKVFLDSTVVVRDAAIQRWPILYVLLDVTADSVRAASPAICCRNCQQLTPHRPLAVQCR